MHVQLDLALEHQRAVDDGVGPDDDPRRRVPAETDRDPAGARLFDLDAALDVRTDADGDVAVDGVDDAVQVGVDQADRAVDGGDVLGDVAAAVDEDAAVDGFDAATDLRARIEVDAAVDRGQAPALHVVVDLDAAVDGLGVADARAGGDS